MSRVYSFQQAAEQAIPQGLELLEPRDPKVARPLCDAEADILAHLAFPSEHWRSLRSNSALERVNAEIDRRAKLMGIFPNSAALTAAGHRGSPGPTRSVAGRPLPLLPTVHGHAGRRADPRLTNPTAGLAA
jgi:hypothetical protein